MIKWFTQDWGIKLISLILAIGLWYYAVGEESVEVERRIPLELKVQNKQLSLLDTSVRFVDVTFFVPRTELSDLASKEIRAIHEISEGVKSAGDYSFALQKQEIKVPSPRMRVIKIKPEIIRATVDELIVQKLPIKPDFVGEPAFGYKIKEDEIKIDPNAILVEGPKGQLEQMDALKTEHINLVGRIRSFRRTVKLSLPEGIKPLSESLIDVLIPIKEEFGEKTFEDIPVKILQSSERDVSVEISPKKIGFTLKGSQIQLEKLSAEKILAYLDVSDLDHGEHQVSVLLVLPEEVSLKEEESTMVNVEIKKKKKIILS